MLTLLAAQTAAYTLAFVVSMTLPMSMQRLDAASTLSTLPNAVMLLATILGSHAVGKVHARAGWRTVFILAGLCAVVAAGAAVAATNGRQLSWLLLAAALYGVACGGAMWLRFARAAGSKPSPQTFMALMTGTGLVAALAAPYMVSLSAGPSILGVQGLSIAHTAAGCMGLAIALAALRLPARPAPAPVRTPAAALGAAPSFMTPALAAGASVFAMGIMMAGTPVTMSICGFGVEAVATSYRAHLVAMFLPSLLVIPLAGRASPRTLMQAGLAVNAVAMGIAMAGLSLNHFVWSMTLNGAGWSLAMVGASSLVAEFMRHPESTRWPGRFNTTCVLLNAAGALSGGAVGGTLGWRTTVALGGAGLLIALVLLLASGGASISPERKVGSNGNG
jgi:hypothetical protein